MVKSQRPEWRPRIQPIVNERRHTLNFLREIRQFSPVFLDTEIDMTAVQRHRTAARAADQRFSLVTYILYAAGRTLIRHPEANAAIQGWTTRPRISLHDTVNGKVTLDKKLNGQRVVLATILPGLEHAELIDIQRGLDPFRDGDPDKMPMFDPVRKLQGLPWPLDRLAYRRVARPLARRGAVLGTFALTSLGHRPVDGFYSVGGTTITLGVGRVVDRPVVRDGAVVVAPTMRLSLTFDHRVIDGAEAADVLAELKTALEEFGPAVVPVPAVEQSAKPVLAERG
ncbi:acyltransferase [Nocardia sp. SYP-A9097]|uniref:2-oxo acid dehydrogenase subunit E2 n=1 Tax=Nocardia sp. SYP-A9097 TaxID=2663237 RepID=UPI00129B2DDE|nr:2-oxo acid dehydrogenase subunit E2 [Nocardia sp. SYP-A9097]MRH92361.1 acyltransferase [Nocardia sp. SYP-A9097]